MENNIDFQKIIDTAAEVGFNMDFFIELGIKIKELQNRYFYKDLIKFIKGESADGSMYFCELKPLYDEFGYQLVNDKLLKFEKEEEKPNE